MAWDSLSQLRLSSTIYISGLTPLKYFQSCLIDSSIKHPWDRLLWWSFGSASRLMDVFGLTRFPGSELKSLNIGKTCWRADINTRSDGCYGFDDRKSAEVSRHYWRIWRRGGANVSVLSLRDIYLMLSSTVWSRTQRQNPVPDGRWGFGIENLSQVAVSSSTTPTYATQNVILQFGELNGDGATLG